jgi:hypothetical protein
MKKSELKDTLKPLIKECVRELIFEEGVLSGIITEVAQGLAPQQTQNQPQKTIQRSSKSENTAVSDAKRQLAEVKSSLQSSIGFKGVFEGTKPLEQSRTQKSKSAYDPLKDMDPNDPGVSIDMWFKK